MRAAVPLPADQPTAAAPLRVSPSVGRTSKTRLGPQLLEWQIRLAKEMMRSDLSETIAITKVASRCGLSMSYFVRAFKNTVGVAPYDWFLGQRITFAKQLLGETQMPLAEIALECGFTDQSHFTKTFGKRIGMTPLQWRRWACRAGSLPC